MKEKDNKSDVERASVMSTTISDTEGGKPLPDATIVPVQLTQIEEHPAPPAFDFERAVDLVRIATSFNRSVSTGDTASAGNASLPSELWVELIALFDEHKKIDLL